VERTSTWLFKENKGGYIPCGSLLVKDFTRLKKISRTSGCLGTGRRHGLWPNQYKSYVCFLLPYTLYFSVVHFLFLLYFCLSYLFCGSNAFPDYFDDAKESRVKQSFKQRFKNQVSSFKIQDSRIKIQESREDSIKISTKNVFQNIE